MLAAPFGSAPPEPDTRLSIQLKAASVSEPIPAAPRVPKLSLNQADPSPMLFNFCVQMGNGSFPYGMVSGSSKENVNDILIVETVQSQIFS